MSGPAARPAQDDDELGSALAGPRALGRGVRLDRAAVQPDQPLGQRQPDAQPAGAPVEGAIGLREEVEDPGQQLGVDAGAVVANPDEGVRASVRRLAPDLDPRPPAGVNLAALSRTLTSTSSIRAASTDTQSGVGQARTTSRCCRRA